MGKFFQTYPKIVASLARTSSTMSWDTLSSFLPFREPKSKALGWSHRMTPVVLVPAPAKETANPAVLAKFPPLVMGKTTGVFVSRLKALGETIRTGRFPCCS